MKRALLIVIAILCLLGQDALALDMDEAVELALEKNHTLKKFKHLQTSAAERAAAATAGFMPSLTLRYTFVQRSEDSSLGESSSIYTIEASYNLFNAMADLHNVKSAAMNSLAAEYTKRAAAADIVFAVKAAYIEVLKADRAIQTAQESVGLLERQRNDAELYYREGLTAKNDLLKVEVELASARLDLLQAEANKRIGFKRLEKTMGVMLTGDQELDDLTEIQQSPLRLYSDMKDEMFSRRSELKYLRAIRASYDYAAKAIRAGNWPRVDALIKYEKFEHDGYPGIGRFDGEDTTGSIVASWNIFDGFNRKHRANEMKFLARSVDEDILNTRKELVFQLREALELHAVSVGKMDVVKTAVSQAEENYRVTENQYRERAATTTDLLDARSFLSRARNQHNTALYDLHLAAVRIERVLERHTDQNVD